MKEHGIIFSSPMVRAIIEGRKTQTRRIVKAERLHEEYGKPVWDKAWVDGPSNYVYLHVPFDGCGVDGMATTHRHYCPHPVGTRLWVRETWLEFPWVGSDGKENLYAAYRATDEHTYPRHPSDRWRPSIHMPRKYSRITLEVTDVRVQRIQSITPDDCANEGIEGGGESDPLGPISLVTKFASLWQSINGEGSWARNDWVWAYTFKAIEVKK